MACGMACGVATGVTTGVTSGVFANVATGQVVGLAVGLKLIDLQRANRTALSHPTREKQPNLRLTFEKTSFQVESS